MLSLRFISVFEIYIYYANGSKEILDVSCQNPIWKMTGELIDKYVGNGVLVAKSLKLRKSGYGRMIALCVNSRFGPLGSNGKEKLQRRP